MVIFDCSFLLHKSTSLTKLCMHMYLSQMNKQLKAKQISQCIKCSILSRSTIEMGQVQNGCLYIRYRSSSKKNEAQECKKPTDYIDLFAILMINLLYKFPQPLIQLRVGFCFKPLPQQAISNWFTLASINGVPFKVKKPNMKILILFIFFLLLFLRQALLKNYMVCVNIMHIK